MTKDKEEKMIWALTQALELYDKGESLHWATTARQVLAEIAGNTIVMEAECGCVIVKSPGGLFSILGQDEGIRVNPLAIPFEDNDEAMARSVIRSFCPHHH